MYRLLVADDEKRLLSGLCEYYPWNELGFTIVARAENGQRALDYIHAQPVDAVLTDIEMPVMSGTRLAEILHEEYPHIKVVFLSGYADFKYAQQALRVGVKDYILKPVKTDELKRVFLKLHKELEAAGSGTADSNANSLPSAVTGSGAGSPPPAQEHNYYAAIVSRVTHYIETNLASASLEEAAQRVSLSPGYLSGLYRQETGMTFTESLLKARMEKARELLALPGSYMYEIAEMLGYGNPKNLSRAFKSYYGYSPRDYRRWEDQDEKKNRDAL